MKDLNLPERSAKARRKGITHVLDKGLGRNAVNDLIETAGSYIDIIKFGWGTGVVVGNLRDKMNLYKNAGIDFCLGGTYFEYAYVYGKLDWYENFLKEYGFQLVEISDGTINLPLKEKVKLIEHFAKDFKVLSEVGSKDADSIVNPEEWSDEIKAALKAGAYKVITESRESGTVGLFNKFGDVDTNILEIVLKDINIDDIIFETPNKSQQVWFIKKFGTNVNLGNIAYDEVISLETLRLGLRGDTFLHFHKKGNIF